MRPTAAVPSRCSSSARMRMASDMTDTKAAPRIFYGWWIVFGCLIVATVGWSLTVFGMGVYIHVLSERRGFSIALISEAVTVSYLISAVCLISVGTAVERLGPKPVISAGVVILAVSVASLGFCRHGWQLFAVFGAMG